MMEYHGAATAREGSDVPEEDAQLTWQGSQSTIMAELQRHRALADVAASVAAAASAGHTNSSYTTAGATTTAELTRSSSAAWPAGDKLRGAPRPHAASVILVRHALRMRALRAGGGSNALTRAAAGRLRRSTTARWPAS